MNKNNPLKYHLDSGNFKGVLSNMIVFKKGTSGGHLVIPQLDLALEVVDNSLTIFNGQEILHGVSPIEYDETDGYRYSVVYYSLEQMWKCDPIDDEIVRIRQMKTEREINAWIAIFGYPETKYGNGGLREIYTEKVTQCGLSKNCKIINVR